MNLAIVIGSHVKMRINCILCVRRKLCHKNLKKRISNKGRCPAKVFRIKADRKMVEYIGDITWGFK